MASAVVVVPPSEFLKVLWGAEESGWAELAVHSKSGEFKSFPWQWPQTDPEIIVSAALKHNQQAHVYVGVCLRKQKWPYPTGRKRYDGKDEIVWRGTEENTLLSNAVWCEFDFAEDSKEGHKGRVIEAPQARAMLKSFPFKPSIIVKSGGGIQVYWLLKEPAQGDDLPRVKAVNRGIAALFTETRADGKRYGADEQAIDLARCLRLPGTINHKYRPPRKCEICYWQPEHRYLLEDFEDILPLEPAPPSASAKPTEVPSGPSVGTPPVGHPPAGNVRLAPTIELDEDRIQKIAKLLEEIWLPGHRHKLALQISGWFAFSGVRFESTVKCIAGVSEAKGGDTADRIRCVETTYTNYVNGAEVQGRPSLEKTLETDLPEVAKEQAKRVVEKIQKLLPKPPKNGENGGFGRGSGGAGGHGGSTPDFDIIRVRKFDSRPARYVVTIRKHGEQEEYDVPCEIDVFSNYRRFRTAYLEVTTNKFLASIKQTAWEYMISQAPLEVVPAPQEATVAGAIRAKLEAFLDEKKENPELGDLKTFPGYNEQGEVFFQLDAFRRRLREAGIKATDREITQVLKDDGWKDDRRWIGTKNPRIWVKALLRPDGGSTNGNGKRGGHGEGGTEGDKIRDLFSEGAEDALREPGEEG